MNDNECTADLDHPCDANGIDDDGAALPCARCKAQAEEDMKLARRAWDVASPLEKESCEI